MVSLTTSAAHHAAAKIQQLRADFHPQVGIVLGSGLGAFAEQLEDAITINYEDLPGFPTLTVQAVLMVTKAFIMTSLKPMYVLFVYSVVSIL